MWLCGAIISTESNNDLNFLNILNISIHKQPFGSKTDARTMIYLYRKGGERLWFVDVGCGKYALNYCKIYPRCICWSVPRVLINSN